MPLPVLPSSSRGQDRAEPAAVFIYRQRQGVGPTDRTDAMATRRTTKRPDRAPAQPTRPQPEERDVELDEERLHARDDHDESEDDDERDTEAAEYEPDLRPADGPAPGELDEFDEDAHAPDDALGLYLRQMGAIPLLSRDEELRLAKQLEMRRRRYRYAAMSCWRTLARIVEAFERVQRGQLALDPTIDVVNTL